MENGFAAPFTARIRYSHRGGVQVGELPAGIQLLNALRGEKALQTYPVFLVEGNVVVDV